MGSRFFPSDSERREGRLPLPLPFLPPAPLPLCQVIVSNGVAVLLGTTGVYESELESELRLNYLAQVR